MNHTSFSEIVETNLHMFHPVSFKGEGLGGIDAFSENARTAMFTMLKHTKPKSVLYLHSAATKVDLQLVAHNITQCMENAGIFDGTLCLFGGKGLDELACDPDDGSRTHVWNFAGGDNVTQFSELFTSDENRADVLLVDPRVDADELYRSMVTVRKLIKPGGWSLGVHQWDVEKPHLLENVAEQLRLNLLFTADVWIATVGPFIFPPLPLPIIGTAETVRFGAISDIVDEAKSRDSFLHCLSDGVSSYLKLGGGTSFAYALPNNVLHQDASIRANFASYFFPPYKEKMVSEGHQIAHMRGLRVAGDKGYAYSRHGQLIEQSIGTGADSVAAIKEIITPYEPILRKGYTVSDNMQWSSMAAIFPRSVELEKPHVVVMWPDIFCYHHWLIGCLPRFWYLDEFPEFAQLPIVMNALDRRFQMEYLSMLGILNKTRFVHFHSSVSLRLNKALYPSHFEAPMHSPGVIAWLRKKFLPHAAKVPAGYESGLYFITRRDGRGRNIANEQEMLDFLEPKGFKVVAWTEFSVAQQIALANHAKVVIGAHGSNMSNTIFVSPDCKVMSLATSGAGETAFDLMLTFGPQSVGAKTYFLIGKSQPGHVAVADYEIDFEEFKSVFFQMMDE
jgi:capsular polysaccharide biosynthesis protein